MLLVLFSTVLIWIVASAVLLTTALTSNQPNTTLLPVINKPGIPTSTAEPISTPTTTPTATSTPETDHVLFGVLQPDPKFHARTRNAGVQGATLELGWDYYEPQDGVWNTDYIREQKNKYEQMRKAGFVIVLDFGIQYPPEWAKNIRPWKDQYGNTYRDEVNAIWSATVRSKIDRYITRIFQDFGTDFWGVRLGSGGGIETLYPDTPNDFLFSYWAFDQDAMSSNPVPDWLPGQPSPRDEARIFYTWYLQHLIDTVNWQQDLVRQHYHGYLIQLMPGQGVRPSQWETLIATNLIPIDRHVFAAERGAIWDKIIDGMNNHHHVIIDCSSVGDASTLSPYTNENDPDPIYWSSAHWVAYNADRYGLLKMSENPGKNDYATMQLIFQQMTDYGYTSLFWAFEPELYSGDYASIDQYAHLITQSR